MNAIVDFEPRYRRLSVDDVYRMVKAGIIDEDERVELIDGELLTMAPNGDDHNDAVMYFTRGLVRAFGDHGLVQVQGPLKLSRFNLPEPDFVVYRDDGAGPGLPTPGLDRVLLVVEVSKTSLRFDRTRKARLYAAHGIGEYWIVDLVANRVLRRTDPGEDGYAREEEVRGKVEVAGVTVDIDALMPRRA